MPAPALGLDRLRQDQPRPLLQGPLQKDAQLLDLAAVLPHLGAQPVVLLLVAAVQRYRV